MYWQVAYLMADISDVDTAMLKDLYESLESLSCTFKSMTALFGKRSILTLSQLES